MIKTQRGDEIFVVVLCDVVWKQIFLTKILVKMDTQKEQDRPAFNFKMFARGVVYGMVW